MKYTVSIIDSSSDAIPPSFLWCDNNCRGFWDIDPTISEWDQINFIFDLESDMVLFKLRWL